MQSKFYLVLSATNEILRKKCKNNIAGRRGSKFSGDNKVNEIKSPILSEKKFHFVSTLKNFLTRRFDKEKRKKWPKTLPRRVSTLYKLVESAKWKTIPLIAFRKIDVDAYSEDNFKDDLEQQQQQQTNFGSKSDAEIQSLIQAGRNVEALKLALHNAAATANAKPGTSPEKEAALANVLKAALSVKGPAAVEKAVKELENDDQRDVLMKCVYRGFERPGEGNQASSLLIWHEKLFEVAGVGAIVRVMTDRKRV